MENIEEVEETVEERLEKLESRASTHNLLHGVYGLLFVMICVGTAYVVKNVYETPRPSGFGRVTTVKKEFGNDLLQQEERILNLEHNQKILNDESERILDHMLKINDHNMELTEIVRKLGGE